MSTDLEQAEILEKAAVIACVPVDRSGLPQSPELDAVVVTDLYTLGTCDTCLQTIWIGPRSLELYRGDPENHLLMCYACTFAMPDIGSWDVQELGGGFPAEGRPRVQ